MEYSSGSDCSSPVQRQRKPPISSTRFIDSSQDIYPRARTITNIGHRISSSKYDGLSWQQYKSVVARRQDDSSHIGRIDAEGKEKGRVVSSENLTRTSSEFRSDGFLESNGHQGRLPPDGLLGRYPSSPISLSAWDTVKGQHDPCRSDIEHSQDARMSTLVGSHRDSNPFERYTFDQGEMPDGRFRRPHLDEPSLHLPSRFHSQNEGSDDNAHLLGDHGQSVPPGSTTSQTASSYNISEFQKSEYVQFSKRTNIQRTQDPRHVDNGINYTTNDDLDVDFSRDTVQDAEYQTYEQLHVQSMFPVVLEHRKNGANLTKQSLPHSSHVPFDKIVSDNSSSLGQKRPRRRKLETEFSNAQRSQSEVIRTQQFAESNSKPPRLGRRNMNVQPDFLGNAAMPDPALSSVLSSHTTSISVQGDQRNPMQHLETDSLLIHQEENLHSHIYRQKKGIQDLPEGVPGSTGSVSPSPAHVVHPQGSASDTIKSSRLTASLYPDGIDQVQDLLMFSTAQSTSEGSTNAKAAVLPFRNHSLSGARATSVYSLTTSKGLSSQYSPALSSYSVPSSGVLDKLPLQTSTLEDHLSQHYTNTGFSTSHLSERYENESISLNCSSTASKHSNYSKLDHQSKIKTGADDVKSSRRGDGKQRSGSQSSPHEHEDLQDFLLEEEGLPFFLQERRKELQRAMNYHFEESEEEETHEAHATPNHDDKMLRCTADTMPKNRGHHLEMSVSTSGSPRQVTSILWVFKLLDILHNHPVEKHEVLVSQAYWFRRWLKKVRLLKMIHEEEKNKWRRAVTLHNMTIKQKYLSHWMSAVQSRSNSARLLYQQHLRHKGLSAFKFAVMSSKIQAEQLEIRLKVMTLVKYFKKWSALTQLRKEKEAILEQIADQHVTVKAFSVWKEGYHAQQRMAIADLHYKVGLLSRSLEHWKSYVAHQRMKYYQKELARVHHEDRLVKRTWVTMATICNERQKARRKYRWTILCRSWKAWRHGIQIMKMENLHDNAKAIVFRDKAILQRFFADWAERTKVLLVIRKREKSRLSQAFELWKLKNQRRKLLYRILDSKTGQTLMKRALLAWRKHTRQCVEARRDGIRLLERVQMRGVMFAWRSWTCSQVFLRLSLQNHQTVKDVKATGIFFQRWKLRWLRARALRRGLERWSEHCLERAAKHWIQHVIERRQRIQAEEFARQSDNACLRRSFSKWVEAKGQADCDRQRAADMQHVLICSRLHRIFLAWKLEMMVTRAVGPLTERRKERCLAKAFDNWRFVVKRKKMGQRFARRCKDTVIATTFRYWSQTVSCLQTKQEQASLEASLVLGCFRAWQRLNQRETSRRTVAKHHEMGLLQEAFTSWKAQAEVAELERQIEMGNEQRRLLLQRLFFKAWRRASGEEAELEKERCTVIQGRIASSTILEMWRRWRRSLELELTARSLAKNCQLRMLKEAFQSWHQHTQQSMYAAVERFHSRLNESCSSLQSPDFLEQSPACSFLSSSASSSAASILQLQAHGTPSLYASSPSPLREVSVHLLEETSTEYFHSTMSKTVLAPTECSTMNKRVPGPSEWSRPSDDIDARGVFPPGQDPFMSASLEHTSGTPSPLRNLHLGILRSDEVDRDFPLPVYSEVNSQGDFSEGSDISGHQGVESSGRSVDSHRSCNGISSVTDSGYHASGVTVISNGEWQIAASSDSTTKKNSKDCALVSDVLQLSPHKNNNNSVSQNRDEWCGFTMPRSSTEDHLGYRGDDTMFLEEHRASPGYTRETIHDVSTVRNTGNLSPLSHQDGSASSRFEGIQRQPGNAKERLSNGILYNSDMNMVGAIGGAVNITAEVNPKVEDDVVDDEDIESSVLGSESLFLTPEKSVSHITNQQTLKAINNKKVYLTSIILRLRLWPASAAFYQWLEYTGMKRIHRQYRSLVEGRMNDADLRAAFQLWRQHSSDRQLACNFQNKRLLEKYFRSWSYIKERESEEERQTSLAEQHASHALLKSSWRTWKEHFLQSSYPIGPRPTWSAHFSQSQLMSQNCTAFQTQIHEKNVKECLMFWRLRWRQLQEVDCYRSKVILKRCLIAWLSWSKEKNWREKAAKNFLEARLKKMAFKHWMSQLAKQDLIHTHYQGAAQNHLCLIIRAWHRWAETSKGLRLKHQVVVQRRDAAILKWAWLSWKQEAGKCRRGQAFHDRKMLLRIFHGWQSVTLHAKQHRVIMQFILSRKNHRVLSSCFRHWQMEYNASKFAQVQECRQARRMLAEVLATWKTFTVERRRERQELLHEAFWLWRNQLLEAKRRKQVALSAATHWRLLVRRSRELMETMNLFRSSVEERRLKRTFIWWQRSRVSCQLADSYHSNRLLKRAMQGLKELLQRSQEHCNLEKQLTSQKRKTLLQVYFRRWKDKQCHMINLHITAIQVKGRLEGRSLSYAFLTWRLLYRERRTEHSYSNKLLLQTWQTWRRVLANQKAAIMRRDREKSLLMQAFHALRTWARDRSGRRIILHCVQTRKNHFNLKMTFAMWLDESRLRRSARGHHNMHIQRKVLIAWRGLIQKQKDLTALHQTVTSQVKERRVREAFRVWKDSYCASRQAEAKLAAFFKRKEASILEKCFRDWRHNVLEVQAQNLRERRLMTWVVDRWRRSVEGKKLIRQYESELEELAVLHWDHRVRQGYFNKWRSALEAFREQRRCFLEQKYGLLWKQRVTQALMAQAMARYGRLERCWKAWRKNFIIDRISKESLEQDQRILLKKVFHRWHQVSVLHRTKQASPE
ncbi:uncharacterized protein LOC129276542 isoform X1 [Lytechinus pictus]|uniref:uncharacterized protein LOC129276542 isoform X1 n=1 Tax=Lytechinus pictus TaxID=7653 RepID=UPI0030BA11C5